MFSGIISNIGTVHQIVRKNEGAILTVHGGEGFRMFEPGESIAVNGVCLTVRDSSEDTFTLDLSTEKSCSRSRNLLHTSPPMINALLYFPPAMS